jgi:rhodanese-related sulfurtransferase
MSHQPTPPPAPEVTIDDLEAHIAQGGLVFDVRETQEYESGHIAGAIALPMSDLQQRWREIPADQGTVHVVCAVGGRSLSVATALREAGIDAVSVAGGTAAWIQSGRPVET